MPGLKETNTVKYSLLLGAPVAVLGLMAETREVQAHASLDEDSALKRDVSEDGFVWVDESHAPFYEALPALSMPVPISEAAIGLLPAAESSNSAISNPWYMKESLQPPPSVPDEQRTECIPAFSQLPDSEPIV